MTRHEAAARRSARANARRDPHHPTAWHELIGGRLVTRCLACHPEGTP